MPALETDRLSTLTAALDSVAEEERSGLRILDRREHATDLPWAVVRQRALEACGRLQAAGIEPGESVPLVYPTSPGFFDAFFGVLLAGAVPVPLYPPVRLGRLDEYHRRTAEMIGRVEARLVLTDRRVRRLLGETAELSRPQLGCRTLESLPEGTPRPVERQPGDIAMVQFSSGTTVAPKPVALSHRAVLAQVGLLNTYWPDTDEVSHVGASWLPLYHDMGLIGCVFPALVRPADLVLIPPEVFVARPATWLRAISRYRATISPAPNFAYGLCVDRIRDEELEGVDLSCWQVALNGAEAVAPDVLRAFNRRFARWGLRPEALTPVYGLSEASLAVTFSAVDRPFTSRRFDRSALASGAAIEEPKGVEIVSNGRPLPRVDLEVRSVDGMSLPQGEVGRVWVRGPSVMNAYLNDPEATAKALRDGWLDTGDLGVLYEDELYLTGRAKDVLILSGRNHSPAEVEQVIDGMAGVRTGCTVAVTHLPEGGRREELLVFVEHRRGDGADSTLLEEKCRTEVLARTGLRIDRVEVLEPGTLPRTSSGKIRRREALERYLRGELSPPERVTPTGIARALVRSSRAFREAKKGQSAER